LDKVQNPQFQNQCKKIDVRLSGLDKNQDLYSNSLNTIRSGNSVSSQEQQSVQHTKDEIVDVLQQNKLYDEEIHLRKQSIEFNTKLNNLAEVSKDRVAISKNLDAKGETSAAIKEAEEAAAKAASLTAGEPGSGYQPKGFSAETGSLKSPHWRPFRRQGFTRSTKH
jgi:hypothetical protein